MLLFLAFFGLEYHGINKSSISILVPIVVFSIFLQGVFVIFMFVITRDNINPVCPLFLGCLTSL